jgi:CubicO group peptidase (beta-lactamase class C family)
MLRACLLVVALGACASHADVLERIARVESGLRPERVPVAGRLSWKLEARMAAHRVPGVSIAVLDGGRLAWTRGYGRAVAGGTHLVDAHTLFQAASVTKPFTAVAALLLAERGRLHLDADVNAQLTSWKLPAAAFAAVEPVTPARLLSHSAGLTVPGFDGYALDEPLPSIDAILDGRAPSRSPAVRVDAPPGSAFRYSGGGYVLLQKLLSDLAGMDFAALMNEEVLAPLHLAHSRLAQPPPTALLHRVAYGHGADGRVLPGGHRVYPELAAGGLWSTPADIARFALALQVSLAGRGGLLSRASVERMLDPVLAGAGLGVFVAGTGSELRFEHSGSNAGYRCFMVHFPHLGRGAVIMTNGDGGYLLIMEIVRAIAAEYDWPAFRPQRVATVAVSANRLARYRGRYEFPGHGSAHVTVEDGRLVVTSPGGQTVRMLAVAEDRFIPAEPGPAMRFVPDAAGAMTLEVMGAVGRRTEQ